MAAGKEVRTRVAPSPTGRMHIGTVRTGLFNYLFARQQGGTYICRVEDTDRERSKPEYEAAIWEDFDWLGITPDERYRQSEHVARHTAALERLIDSGAAYLSKEPAKDDPEREVEVVRLKNTGRTITFTDLIRGEVTFDTTELGDMVIARSMTDPLYHLAVVVDDAEMGITHVIRGEDHISNTPRQILIQEALGYERPVYAHLPLIMAPDRSKLSKRKHAAGIDRFRAEGYQPAAIINFLALLGWNPGTDQEIFSLDQLVAAFDLSQVQKGGAVFNEEKLRWFNREYLLAMPEEAFRREALATLVEAVAARGLPWDQMRGERLVPLLRERTEVWGDIRTAVTEGEYDFFFTDPEPSAALIPGKGESPSRTAEILTRLAEMIGELPDEAFDEPERLKEALWDYASEVGRGAVLWPLRYGLSGREKSPDPFFIMSIVGKETTLARIQTAKSLVS